MLYILYASSKLTKNRTLGKRNNSIGPNRSDQKKINGHNRPEKWKAPFKLYFIIKPYFVNSTPTKPVPHPASKILILLLPACFANIFEVYQKLAFGNPND